MLVLQIRDGGWVEVTHRSGDVIRIKVQNLNAYREGSLDMVFNDPDFNFRIEREERLRRGGEPPFGGQRP